MYQAVGRLNRYNAKRRLIVNLGVFNFEYTFFIVSSVLNVNDKVKPFGKMNKMDSFKAYMMPKKSGNKQNGQFLPLTDSKKIMLFSFRCSTHDKNLRAILVFLYFGF